MFVPFFYLLRARGVKVSVNEWLALVEALEKGLGRASFTEFYYLCRAVLVKSEADFDKFDGAFLEYFKDIDFTRGLPAEILKWLSGSESRTPSDIDRLSGMEMQMDPEQVISLFQDRLQNQEAEHNGGFQMIGQHGFSPFGNQGGAPGGIRVSGGSRNRRGFAVAGDRRFRDFREDQVVDVRRYQMALRALRQYSNRMDLPKTELDIDQTVKKTGDNAGHLKLVWDRPRKNTVKLLLMIDSGGSMDEHSAMCTMLFQAVSKANHFKDLKIYYFHNCIRGNLYKNPQLDYNSRVTTEWVLKNLGSDYKVIILGDAMMDPRELTGSWFDNGLAAIDWLRKFTARYPRMIWFVPQLLSENALRFRSGSFGMISNEVETLPMTVENLQKSIKKLLVAR